MLKIGKLIQQLLKSSKATEIVWYEVAEERNWIAQLLTTLSHDDIEIQVSSQRLLVDEIQKGIETTSCNRTLLCGFKEKLSSRVNGVASHQF